MVGDLTAFRWQEDIPGYLGCRMVGEKSRKSGAVSIFSERHDRTRVLQ